MNNAVTVPVTSALVPRDMDGAFRLAEMMARGKMVPDHLKGSAADCFMVIEQAMRWNMSPFAVAQCTSSIKGKLMFEGKLVAAAVESSGAIVGNLDYTFTGTGDDRVIKVSGRRVGDAEVKTVEVKLRDARTDNPLWKRQPDQQLVYHGVRVWARRWTPAVILGVYSREEMGTPEADEYVGTTIDAVAEPVRQTEPVTYETPGTTPGQFLDALEAALNAAQTADAVDAIQAHPRVQKAMDAFTNGHKARLLTIMTEAIHRTEPPENNAPNDDDDFPGGRP